MLINHIAPWDLPEHMATPEDVFMNRRMFLATGGAAIGLGLSGFDAFAANDPSAGLYPAKRNPAYKIERALTPEAINSKYNNFYEFGGTKQISAAAQALNTRPWTIKIDGEVDKPLEIDIDVLFKKMGLEERLYRHRCVEAWSMTVPWTGFPLKKLVELANPNSSAKYLQMQTFLDPKVAPGQRPRFWGLWSYDWPYTEGLTMAEATNDLAFLVTGAYGKPMAKQFGAPLRLATPWKYGFKSVKSITRFSFVRERPKTFWNIAAPNEYGFWANVNPNVPHARWSQATERVLGGTARIPTKMFNGYGEQVAEMYKNIKGERLYY